MPLSQTQRQVLEAALGHPERLVVHFPAHLKGGARGKVLAALISAARDNFAIVFFSSTVPVVHCADEGGAGDACIVFFIDRPPKRRPDGCASASVIRSWGPRPSLCRPHSATKL